ncbi:ATP-dependent Lhr-like helicase [Chiayiivirga flava]|uniref:ATP-dependent Lhr-like helicase n=1 Tax=Chiayiivirga flava TaxID=659595 RepID=A0A7W8G0F5_9GAMM|nr:DEAD/DEAH box helicase [Chiayiivirga flava]MBB5206690.1 ATP-dependent Lhr-like helicase [Chiayiivirga flava]
MPLHAFHPAVAAWFNATFPAPTDAQAAAWPAIQSGRHVLVAAPTGSGKTLTAFLAAIDDLVRQGLRGELADLTQIIYVSPLKALSNDIRINLEAPLAGIRAELSARGLPDVEIRTAVRTGDTPQKDRAAMRKHAPHVLVTTPESLYVLLGSESGRVMLGSTRTVIVDEIHAIAGSKRGSHLALSLERLQALCERPLQRIGLSATQKPIEVVARFLVGGCGDAEQEQEHPLPPSAPSPAAREKGTAGADVFLHEAPAGFSGSLSRSRMAATQDLVEESTEGILLPQSGGRWRQPEGGVPERIPALPHTRNLFDPTDTPAPPRLAHPGHDCVVIDTGHVRRRDLALELPPVPLDAVMSNDTWELVYNRLAELVQAHRTTLIFVNTRRMAERACRHLAERLGKDVVAAHHGSLAKELRLDAEQRLKAGALRVLVATASLELGIDIGDIDLVCQLGSPRSIAAFLQRVGRAGHAVGATPKGRLFPQSRDELVECAALLDCVRRGELDALILPPQPLDVLSQQIVAEVACREWSEDALYALVRRAYPYRDLARADFDAVVRMLAEGFTNRRGTHVAHVHRDAVQRVLRERRGARLTALSAGGTIPDTADYAVVLEPQAQTVGSVHEDFAVESLAGDVFQLGNTSYRILRVERDKLRVEDAQGAAPTIPFWIGEAPGRSRELSLGVSRLRETLAEFFTGASAENADIATVVGNATHWLQTEVGLDESAARQLADYLAQAQIALGLLPTQQVLAMERFFDESGGTQLIIHSPYGSRLNRAWGLALRKRFCRSFNFELQAAATEDAIVLSLSTSHSFPLEDVAKFLHSNTAKDVLVQALLDAPLFGVRWRWNAVTALALPRFSGGKKVAPQLQRMKSEDLLATVFPDQVACLENIVGERQIPDHPLVAQTLYDCLHEAMDVEGFLALLRGLESGVIRIAARDLTAPSPLAAEVLGARPYAFLDDAPLEERRTQAVQSRRWSDVQQAEDLGRLDGDAIDAVRVEAWPEARNVDEMHEALYGIGFLTQADVESNRGWAAWLDTLATQRRATRLVLPQSDSRRVASLAAAITSEGTPEGSTTCRTRVELVGSGDPEPSSGAARHLLPGGEGQAGAGVPDGRQASACSRDIREVALAPLPPGEGLGRGSGTTATRQCESDPSSRTTAKASSADADAADANADADADADAAQQPIWITAERLPQFHVVFGTDIALDPAIAAPPDYAAVAWTREDALRELLRARLSGLGPRTVAEIAASLHLPASDIDLALLALEGEGYVMRGHFTPGGSALEWCERHLLARIHRYTLGRLRREIEPVEPRDFMRFLFDWQRVSPDAKVTGPDALASVLGQLEGFEAPAAAWESEILPARVNDYSISWLDDLCLAGRVAWARVQAGAPPSGEKRGRHAGPVRSTPIALLSRRNRAAWSALGATPAADDLALTSRAQRVADWLKQHGASFFDELLSGVGLLRAELEDALAELVARGVVVSDSFSGLRALLVPASKRQTAYGRRGRRVALFGIEDAGRWTLARRQSQADDADTPPAAAPSRSARGASARGRTAPAKASAGADTVELVVRTLLRRYGVLCFRLLEREAGWLPPWRDMQRVLHRLEARGELRGGRFIAGLSGEQFALPDAIPLLRKARARPDDGTLVSLSGADPLNLVGSVLPGGKVPRLTGARVIYRDGIPVATRIGDSVELLVALTPDAERQVRRTLRGEHTLSAHAPFEQVHDDGLPIVGALPS